MATETNLDGLTVCAFCANYPCTCTRADSDQAEHPLMVSCPRCGSDELEIAEVESATLFCSACGLEWV